MQKLSFWYLKSNEHFFYNLHILQNVIICNSHFLQIVIIHTLYFAEMQTLTQCITLSTSLMEICKFIRLSHSAATWILGARGESYIRFDQPSNFQLSTNPFWNQSKSQKTVIWNTFICYVFGSWIFLWGVQQLNLEFWAELVLLFC